MLCSMIFILQTSFSHCFWWPVVLCFPPWAPQHHDLQRSEPWHFDPSISGCWEGHRKSNSRMVYPTKRRNGGWKYIRGLPTCCCDLLWEHVMSHVLTFYESLSSLIFTLILPASQSFSKNTVSSLLIAQWFDMSCISPWFCPGLVKTCLDSVLSPEGAFLFYSFARVPLLASIFPVDEHEKGLACSCSAQNKNTWQFYKYQKEK